jgi:hypothetical protein
MTSAYISYLPKHNSYRPKTSAASSVTYFHADNNAHNCFIKMRIVLKSAVENKLNALNIFIKTAALVFLIVFSEAAIPVLSGKSNASLTIHFYPHRPYYQTFRTFRI